MKSLLIRLDSIGDCASTSHSAQYESLAFILKRQYTRRDGKRVGSVGNEVCATVYVGGPEVKYFSSFVQVCKSTMGPGSQGLIQSDSVLRGTASWGRIGESGRQSLRTWVGKAERPGFLGS